MRLKNRFRGTGRPNGAHHRDRSSRLPHISMFELYRRPTPKRPMTTWHQPRGAPVAPFGCASHCQWPDHADRRNFGLGEARGKFENASAAAVSRPIQFRGVSAFSHRRSCHTFRGLNYPDSHRMAGLGGPPPPGGRLTGGHPKMPTPLNKGVS